MGILGLTKLLQERSPKCIKEKEMDCYADRKVAIDASMSIYQFVIAMRQFEDGESVELKNANGDVTTHLIGIWSRTLRMIGLGLKPIYVFDGTPPDLKSKELDERRKKAADAEAKFEKAKEEGDEAVMEQMSKRTVRVSRDQVNECKKLLSLMGVPCVDAMSEAEAQCVELVRNGKAWAVGTEDMDALTFGAPTLLRHLTFSEAKKKPVLEISLKTALEGLGFTQEQFIDMCILLGCDYSPKIPGIGPMKAFEGIQKHGNLEAFLASLDQTKHPIPEGFANYKEVQAFFKTPTVYPAAECNCTFKEPDEEGLYKFLVEEKMFDAARVAKGVDKLKNALKRKTQERLDQWFKPVAPDPTMVPAFTRKKPTSANGVGQKRSRSETNAPGGKVGGSKKAVRK